MKYDGLGSLENYRLFTFGVFIVFTSFPTCFYLNPSTEIGPVPIA